MKKIFKYPVNITDSQNVVMPAGAEILTVQIQGRTPVLWALVDESGLPTQRRIEVHGTGNAIQNSTGLTYIGTIQTHEGQFVWHYFERV